MTYRMLIGGDWVEGERGTYPIINPATEQEVGGAPEASAAQAVAATEAAAAAFPAWSRTTPEHRADLLAKAADLVRAKIPDLVDLVQAETGATMRVAKTMQLPSVADRLDRYARGALEQHSIAWAGMAVSALERLGALEPSFAAAVCAHVSPRVPQLSAEDLTQLVRTPTTSQR